MWSSRIWWCLGLVSIVNASVPSAAADTAPLSGDERCGALTQDHIPFAKAIMTAEIERSLMGWEAPLGPGAWVRIDAKFLAEQASGGGSFESALKYMEGLIRAGHEVGGEPGPSEDAILIARIEAEREAGDLVPALVKACGDAPDASLVDDIKAVLKQR